MLEEQATYNGVNSEKEMSHISDPIPVYCLLQHKNNTEGMGNGSGQSSVIVHPPSR